MADSLQTRDVHGHLGSEELEAAINSMGRFGVLEKAYKWELINLAEYSSAVGTLQSGTKGLTDYGKEMYDRIIAEHGPRFVAHMARERLGFKEEDPNG